MLEPCGLDEMGTKETLTASLPTNTIFLPQDSSLLFCSYVTSVIHLEFLTLWNPGYLSFHQSDLNVEIGCEDIGRRGTTRQVKE